MCAIIGWSGEMPKGLLTKLLTEAESRGHDSVGLAFRNEGHSMCYRHAVSAKEFVQKSSKMVGEARRSKTGIAHTRRASPNMPINNDNAHPFIFNKIIFAHNGRVENWEALKQKQLLAFQAKYCELVKTLDPEMASLADAILVKGVKNPDGLAKLKTVTGYADLLHAATGINWCQSATTDSMVLGPNIYERNFSDVVGCMGLVWMMRDTVYTMRHNKEAVSATLHWTCKPDSPSEVATEADLCLVASTKEIIEKAVAGLDLKGLKDHTLEVKITGWNEFPENIVYRIEPTGLVAEGEVPINQTVVSDKWSSIDDAAVAAY